MFQEEKLVADTTKGIDEDYEDREGFGCVFPGRCVMPGLHYESECATAEMIEQMYADNEA